MWSLGVLCVSYPVLNDTVGTVGSAPGECRDVNPLKIPFPALVQFQSQPFSVIFSPGSQNLAANNWRDQRSNLSTLIDDLESYLKEIIWFRQKRRKKGKYKSAKTWLKWTQNIEMSNYFHQILWQACLDLGKSRGNRFSKLTTAKKELLTFCTLASAFHTYQEKTFGMLLKRLKNLLPIYFNSIALVQYSALAK